MSDLQRLNELCDKTHKAQAIWFLNGFWDEFGGDSEKLWSYVAKFVELDEAQRAEGNSVDEFSAHRFLEFFQETLTVQAMRDKLRSVGAIGPTDRPKRVPLTHFLLWKYNVDWRALINAPQGSKEEIEKAQRMLAEVQAAFAECERRDNEAASALRESQARERDAKEREAEAKASEADARAREEELRAAKEELEAALYELKAQEDAYNGRTEELKHLSESGTSMVAKNRAKNELAQHLGEDPLPLRRAKITQEAAVKKADRAATAAAEARAAAEEASRQASQARAEAEQARRRSEQAKAAAEEALDEAARKVEEAEAYLEEAKNKGVPQGHLWWLERELHEAKAYLPASKGGYKKNK